MRVQLDVQRGTRLVRGRLGPLVLAPPMRRVRVRDGLERLEHPPVAMPAAERKPLALVTPV